MKKSLILFLTLFFLSFPLFSIAQTYTCSFDMGSSGTGTGIVTDTNCNQAQYYPVIGPLCKDSNANLIYTGTGTGVVLVGGGTGCTGNLCAITASANGLSLIEAANYAAMETLLGYYTSSDVGVTIEGYDSTILKSASIGSTVQAHNSTLDALAAVSLSVGYLYWNGSAWAFQTPSGSGTILGSLAATQYAIPMGNGTANTLTTSQWLTDSSGDLLLPTGAVIKINNVTVLGSGSNGSYYLGLGNNTSYTPVSGQYRFLFLNGVPEVDVNGTASAICLAGGTCSGFQGTLISGTNIKTVSGHALLGSGDVALNVNDVANSLAFSGSPTTGHLAQIGAANTIVDGGTGSNLSVAYAVNAGTAAAANSVAGGNVSGNVAGANAVAVGGITGLGTGVATALAAATNTIGAFLVSIASGSANIPTGTIGANACVTLTAANASVVSGDIVDWSFGGNYSALAGFTPPNMLAVMSYVGSGNVDWLLCNNTAANITPAANMTINWRVRR
jgi:hypothetical protein